MKFYAALGLSLVWITTAIAAEPIKLTKKQVEEVQRVTRSKTRDPSSAIFSQIQGARTQAGKTAVCGLINGKNGYGGFAGNTPFFGMFYDEGYQLVISEDASGSLGVGAMCSKLGINLSP